MSRWIPALLLAGFLPLAAQEKTVPPSKLAPPAEEDRLFLNEEVSFNPLQSQKSVEVGDGYFKQRKFQPAADRYRYAVRWNDGNAEAWLKLGEAEEKLRHVAEAREAYTKYLALSPGAKNAAAIRKRVDALK